MRIQPWRMIQWDKKPAARLTFATEALAEVIRPAASESLRSALEVFGSPHVPGATPLEEAGILLCAGAEVEHALLVEYLYAALSTGTNAIGGTVLTIAIQEMCHFITVQNLLLFIGSQPFLGRQDQDPDPKLDPFPFSLRPFTKDVLEDFLLAEMPPTKDMSTDQERVMRPIIDKHKTKGQIVNPVGLIYARLYWLLQENDQPTTQWPEVATAGFPSVERIAAFPGQGTATTLQVAPAQETSWRAQFDRGGIFANIDSREAALDAVAAIAAQGEGLAGTPDGQSHFSTFLQIYNDTNFGQLSLPKWPTDPFAADQPATSPVREANRIDNKLAGALCGVFDARYRIMLGSLRAALSRDRSNAEDASIRTKYSAWAFQEMLSSIKGLGRSIAGLPCKAHGTVDQLSAAPTFDLGQLDLPDEPAALDAKLLELHRAAGVAITAALAENPGAGTAFTLKQMQQTDKGRFPNL
jgi:hypothetical protein